MARTRSSRLFVVLLHLVGVSTDERWHNTNNNPLAIALEKVQLTHEGLEGLIRDYEEYGEDSALSQPFWLQDDSDGLCMGPMGTFSQCGDVTLWYIRESTFISKRRRRRRATQLAYALQYSQQTEDGPCLQFKDTSNSQSQKKVAMGSCHASLDRVFAWTVNGRGVLHREVSSSSSKRLLAGQQHQHHQSPQCLWRVNNNVTNTNTHLAPCHPADNDNNNNKNEHVDRRLAHLSLVRYQPASVVHERTNRILAAERERIANETRQAANATTTTAAKEEEATVVVIIEESDAPEQQQHIPRYKDRARSHASQPLQHATVKSSSNKRMGSVVRSAAPEETKEPKKRSIFTLQDTNPILFLGDSLQQEANKKQQQQQQQQQQPKNNNKGAAASNHKLVHSQTVDADTYKLRRLHTHPYIAASKNELWTDPQTNLAFRTDLCDYLGDDRKANGRHTIAGVGYYTKTVLNIKIYGVALYVSKRDILADPTFEQYSSLTADELRNKPDFYSHLREMPAPHDAKAGLVDRTIFLKLNMQLSVETMQSSLHATWKLLTEERKMLLINSSMQPRPAQERMLQLIQSSENTGRCSCGQIAPPEYNADPKCCARGTELVFTWRKNGDLEIRLDGRVMDIFPRPDVARGIFYEYLRTDDPISTDFSQHAVDGFPFLLGPLAQVKGMPQAIQMNEAVQHEKNFGIGKAVGNFADMMGSHAGGLAGWVHGGASGAVGNVANAAKTIGATARSVGEGLDRRRDELWFHMSTLPENGKHFIQRRLSRGGRPDELAASVAHYMKRRRRGEIQMKRRGGPRGRVFRSSVNQWLGSEDDADDIVSTVANPQNTYYVRLVFLYLSHLYLLLLLIVSLPGTHHTKLVVRRSPKKQSTLDSSSMSEDDDASTESSSVEMSPGGNTRISSSSDTWTIGSGRRRRSKGGFRSRIRERKRSFSRGRPPIPPLSPSAAATSPSRSGMKKSLSYYL